MRNRSDRNPVLTKLPEKQTLWLVCEHVMKRQISSFLISFVVLISLCTASANAQFDEPLFGLTSFFRQFGNDLEKDVRSLSDDVGQIITGSTHKFVDIAPEHPVGSIIIRTSERKLYLVVEHGKALRYPVGVGREGFQWGGVSYVSRKKVVAELASSKRDD